MSISHMAIFVYMATQHSFLGQMNSTAEIFIFGYRDQVDPEWDGRVTRS